MTEKSSVERAHNIAFEGIMDALMNEGITMDDMTGAIQLILNEYKQLGKRLTPTKRRII